MKKLIAIAAIFSAAAFAQSPPADAVSIYLARAQLAYRTANVDPSSAQTVQPYYGAAMAAAVNTDQRKAIALHWAAVRSCISQSGRQYGEDYDDHLARVQPCEAKMSDRAAEIEAAGYGN